MSIVLSTSNSQRQCERRFSSRSLRPLVTLFVVSLIACQSIGCSSDLRLSRRLVHKRIDKRIAEYRDTVWARRAFNLRYSNCDRNYSQHYENGFIEGYSAVCNGEKGYVPAMPPESYWGTEYRSNDGSKCVNAWFEGFPAGAQAAKKDGAGAFHDIYISKMINSAIVQDKAKGSLDLSVPKVAPPVAPGSTQAGDPSLGPGILPAVDEQGNRVEPELNQLKMPISFQPIEYDESLNN